MSREAIHGAIAPLVEALRADGADLEVAGIGGGIVELRLLLDDASCAECVMPTEVLEGLLFDAIVASGQEVDRVRLLDPRGPDGRE